MLGVQITELVTGVEASIFLQAAHACFPFDNRLRVCYDTFTPMRAEDEHRFADAGKRAVPTG